MSQKFLKFTSESLSASYIPFHGFWWRIVLPGCPTMQKCCMPWCWIGRAFQKSTVFLKLTAPSEFTSPWNRRRRSCTAADNVRRGYFMSLSSAVWSAERNRALENPHWLRWIIPLMRSWFSQERMAQYRTNKSRKQGVFCPTSAEKTQENIFSHNTSEKRVYAPTEAIKEETSERRKNEYPKQRGCSRNSGIRLRIAGTESASGNSEVLRKRRWQKGICRMEIKEGDFRQCIYIKKPGGLPWSAVLPAFLLPVFNFFH